MRTKPMYKVHTGEAYESEGNFNTHFNAINITDNYEFISEHGEDLKEIIVGEDTSRHMQSLGIEYPNSVQSFIREGSVVSITEISETEYVGIVKTIENSTSYSGDMLLDEGDELIGIELVYKYDRENDDRVHFKNRNKSDVEEVYSELQILVGNMGRVDVFNKDLQIDLFCIISDEFLADILNCEEELLSLVI